MALLISNDDGVHAPGLLALHEVLSEVAEVSVVAPNRDRSGVSNCLTLDRPIQTYRLENGFIAIDGTPVDCVHLGTAGIFMPEPERVISGINFGANMGDDVLYSGTLAAAMEGRFLKTPAIAFSLATHSEPGRLPEFGRAARLALRLLELVDALDAPPRTVFNINIPDLPADRIRGIRLTRLGQRLRSENPISTLNPRGKTLYWIGRAGGPVEMTEGTDFRAVDDGFVSITPLHADMTADYLVDDMRSRLSELTDDFRGAEYA